ncbi:ArnT family glycosyltransferase [Patescibacteria group bacterium]
MRIRKIPKSKGLLLAIVIIASILRLWHLGSIPPGLTPDEASLGYNAYSILKTGKDEFGKVLPIVFKSFGDYKPGLYVYLDVPFVAILGLNEFSTRLPSALAGILVVYLIYTIAGKLFSKQRLVPLMAALIAATNPWLIYFSRGAWEANISLALTLTGTYFFLKAMQNPKYLIASSVAFASTFLTYQGAKLSTFIVLLILTIIYRKECKKLLNNKKNLAISVVLGLIIFLPIVIGLFKGQAARLGVFSAFTYHRPHEYILNILDQGQEKVGSLSYNLFHTEGLNFVRVILGHYFNHFSGRFLLFEGDWQNPRHSAPNSGMMLLSNIFLLVFGLVCLIKSDKVNSKSRLLFLLWLFLAPLPSALSRDQVHAVRSFNMVVPIIIVGAFGLNYFFAWVSKQKSRLLLFILFWVLYVGSLIYFLDSYFVHLAKHNSQLWEYGYKQVVETVFPIQSNYEKVIVQQSFEQPYIYFLFFEKYDPVKFQQRDVWIESDFKGDVGFTEINWPVESKKSGYLLIGPPVKISETDVLNNDSVNLIREIKYLNDRDTAFRIVEVK